METRQKQTATPSLATTKKNKERKFSPGASHLQESKSYQQGKYMMSKHAHECGYKLKE